jgi:hypothetical protein
MSFNTLKAVLVASVDGDWVIGREVGGPKDDGTDCIPECFQAGAIDTRNGDGVR